MNLAKIKKNNNTFLIILGLAFVIITLISVLLAYNTKLKTNLSSDKDTKALQKQSKSTDVESIEEDIDATDLSDLDKELSDIEKELDAVY